MLQKAVIGFLVIVIIGAVVVGISDATRQPAEDNIGGTNNAEDVADTTTNRNVQNQPEQGQGNPLENRPSQSYADETVSGQPQQQYTDMVGDPWTANGMIAELDDFGMMLTLDDGSQIYVELGPPTYWQAQGVTLVVGDMVLVAGFFNGEQYHAQTVVTSDRMQIVLRNTDGQPLWSGGANNQSGSITGGQQGAGTGQTPVAPEDWVTLEGIVTASNNGGLTIQTEDSLMTLQMGQPRFWQAQGVTLAAGDEISVLGFWQGTQFQLGEITKLATGERIMLRDPNGRPLWAGAGRNGGGQGGNGQGTQGSDGRQGNNGQGQGGQGGRNEQ